MSATLTLWGGGTVRTLRAHWALCESGIEYNSELIGPRTGETKTPEFTSISSRQKIPVLDHAGFVIRESAAIVFYVAENFATELIPNTPQTRAKLFEWSFFTMMELDATSLYIVRRHDALGDIYGAAPDVCSAARSYFARYVGSVDEELGDGRPYILGDVFTVADILLATTLHWAGGYGVTLSSAQSSYVERTMARDAFKKANEVNRRVRV